MDLSKTMRDTIMIMQEHGELMRYEGGFWSWDNVETKPLYNGGKIIGTVPVWYCSVITLRALEKRGLVTLFEEQKICRLNLFQKLI